MRPTVLARVLSLTSLLLFAACGSRPPPGADAGNLCSDGVAGPDEADVDCGGECAPCALGKKCRHGNDCQSGLCHGGVCAECALPSACPGEDSECRIRTCENGRCGVRLTLEGARLASQNPRDCRVLVCGPDGGVVSASDDSDLPIDGNDCTDDVCTDGIPSNPPRAAGSSCARDGGTMCNGAGACVQCLAASDCPGQDSDCRVRSCQAGACGFSFVDAGTPVASDAPRDCRRNVCDGTGNVTSIADDTDLPVDGNDCTFDVCSGGAPSNPPRPARDVCAQDGGTMCNGAGVCVQCLAASDCPGQDTDCQARACSLGRCSLFTVDAGAPALVQASGDCQVRLCDGTGGVSSAADDNDTPNDGNQCTDDACVNGAPSFAPRPQASPCTQDGGNVCDGFGTCVQCLTAAHCPGQDTECRTRTCTANVCGEQLAPQGTPLSMQTAGDCRRATCDGMGGVVSAVDDADLPVDGRDCTADLCTNGTPSNPPQPEGAVCSQDGGIVCDGQGACSRPLVVVRVGNGMAGLSTAAAPVFIEPFHSSGVRALGGFVLPLPTAPAGNNQPCTLSGTAASEGHVSTSADGRYCSLACYAAAPGTAMVSSSASSAVNRVVARFDVMGAVDTSTRLGSAFSGQSVRGATSHDGTAFWVSGNGNSSTGGVHYVALGSDGGSTRILDNPNNARFVNVFGGQLYGSAASGAFTNVFAIGSGLPTDAGQTATPLPGMPDGGGASPYGFAMLDMSPGIPGLDTLYVADDRSVASGGGVQKWVFDGTSWTLAATFNAGLTTGTRSVAAFDTGLGVAVFATTAETSQNKLVMFLDNGATSPTATVIATAGVNMVYRGVAIAPR